MPSPFVYRSLQSIRPDFSVGTLRHVNSLFHFRHLFFYGRCRLFAHIQTTSVSPNCVCYQCLTTGMCNPAHCPHTLCPMKCLVLAYSTIVTISMSGLISLLVKRQTVNPSPGAVTGGKLVHSSHKRGELRYTVI